MFNAPLQMSSDSGDYVHYDMAFDDRDEGTTASASLAGLATNYFFTSRTTARLWESVA